MKTLIAERLREMEYDILPRAVRIVDTESIINQRKAQDIAALEQLATDILFDVEDPKREQIYNSCCQIFFRQYGEEFYTDFAGNYVSEAELRREFE